MAANNAAAFGGIPLRNAKAELREVRKLNPEAGEVITLALANSQMEPKAFADDLGISHSLALRGLKSEDGLSFHRMWDLSDAFWLELLVAIARKRRLATVRTTIEIDGRRSA